MEQDRRHWVAAARILLCVTTAGSAPRQACAESQLGRVADTAGYSLGQGIECKVPSRLLSDLLIRSHLVMTMLAGSSEGRMKWALDEFDDAVRSGRIAQHLKITHETCDEVLVRLAEAASLH